MSLAKNKTKQKQYSNKFNKGFKKKWSTSKKKKNLKKEAAELGPS